MNRAGHPDATSMLLLLLPRTTYRAEGFLQAAQHLKIALAVATEHGSKIAAPPGAVRLWLDFHDLDTAAQTVLDFAKDHAIDAVLGVDDQTTIVAAAISAALKLRHNSVEAVSTAGNKYRMRELLRQHGVPVPNFSLFSIDENPETAASKVKFPCVIKPLTLSASCGIIRADNVADFVPAFLRVAALLRRMGLAARNEYGRRLLVEDFIPGQEIALEGLLSAGRLRVLAVFDKPDPLNGPFFEETIYVTPSRLAVSTQQKITACTRRAVRALGLTEGPIHAEMRINQEGVWIIEVAARSIGGRCSRTLRFAAGMSLEELLLRHALRMELPALTRPSQAAGVMMLPIPSGGVLAEVRGQPDALSVPGIEELVIAAQPGEELVPLPEGTRYLGFLIARGKTPEAVEASLRDAHRRLDILINPLPAFSSRTIRF